MPYPNEDRLNQLADFLENLPAYTALKDRKENAGKQSFCMAEWYKEDPECGSIGCIAGWAVELFEHPDRETNSETRFLAAELLDLRYDEAMDLFTGGLRHFLTREIDGAMAAEACRHVADGDPPDVAWDRVAQDHFKRNEEEE